MNDDFILKGVDALSKADRSRVVHPHSSALMMSDDLVMNSVLRSQTKVLVLRPDRGELNPSFSLFQTDGSLRDGIYPHLLEGLEKAEEASPVESEADRVRKAQKEQSTAEAIAKENRCTFENFVIKRLGFKLKFDEFVPSDYYEANAGSTKILQAISENHVGTASEAESFKYQGVSGKKTLSVTYDARCLSGYDECVSVFVENRTRGISLEPTQLFKSPLQFKTPDFGGEIPAFKSTRQHKHPLWDFLKYRIRPKITDFNIITYRFQNEACCNRGRKQCVLVEFYPQYAWNGGLTFSSEIKMEPGKKADTDWKVSGDLTIATRGEKATFQSDILSFGELLPSWTERVTGFIQTLEDYKDKAVSGLQNTALKEIIPHPDYSGAPTIEITSAVKLSGNAGLIEIDNSPLVGSDGNVSVGLDPLLQANVKFDLLPSIVKMHAGEGLGQFILDALKKASEEGFGVDGARVKAGLSIEFTITGALKGTLNWEWLTAETRMIGSGSSMNNRSVETKKKFSATVNGEITISLLGRAHLDFEAFEVRGSFELQAKVEGVKPGSTGVGFGGELGLEKEGDKPCMRTGDIYFTGLKIVYSALTIIGVEKDKSENKKDLRSRGRGGGKRTIFPKIKIKAEKDGEIQVLDSFAWFEKKKEIKKWWQRKVKGEEVPAPDKPVKAEVDLSEGIT